MDRLARADLGVVAAPSNTVSVLELSLETMSLGFESPECLLNSVVELAWNY